MTCAAFVAQLLLVSLLAIPALGQDVRQRTTLVRPSPIWVGQRVILVIELLSPTFFESTPVFDLPKVPGATILAPTERPVLSSETIDGSSYTVQRHELSLIATRAGAFHIPAFDVRFAISAGIGKPPAERSIITDAIDFEAKMPAGAEALSSLISTNDLSVEVAWTPESQSVHVGDAVTQRVTIRAHDTPAMAIPPLLAPTIAGLAAYPKVPEVRDQSDRGTLVGQRVESMTYICQEPGTFTVPTYALAWYDIDDGKLKTASIAGKVIKVEPGPATQPSAQPTTPRRASPPSLDWGLLVFIGVAGVCVFVVRKPLARAIAAWRKKYKESESASFARLRRACRGADERAILQSLHLWAVKAGVSIESDPALSVEAQHLAARRYGPETGRAGAWSASALLRAARDCRHRPHQRAATAGLRPLNP